jgi:DNA-binding response OmpR family regulator
MTILPLFYGNGKTFPEFRVRKSGYLYMFAVCMDFFEFIVSIFSNDYQHKLYSNRKVVLEAAPETIPNLIISDLMIRKMDVMEISKEIKSSKETCHIPFFILTAKVGEETIVTGYECSADFNIKEPYNSTVFFQQATKALETRVNQFKYFSTNTDSTLDLPHINVRDKKLLETINELVLEHMAEEEYSILSLTKDLCISRTLLHTKLKGIVGLSATEYVNKIKLKEGLRLLDEGYNISEVSYITGSKKYMVNRHVIFQKRIDKNQS